MHFSKQVTVDEVQFEVDFEYEVLGTEEEDGIEDVFIYIGNQEVYDVLKEDVIEKIYEKCLQEARDDSE